MQAALAYVVRLGEEEVVELRGVIRSDGEEDEEPEEQFAPPGPHVEGVIELFFLLAEPVEVDGVHDESGNADQEE